MTKWFIEKICVAKNDNPSFPGAIHRYIYGKKQTIVCNKVIRDVNNYSGWVSQSDRSSDKDFLNEFGYHSKKLAESVLVRQLKHLPEKDRYWDDKYKIIEIDI